jgi:hypothetical protein
MAKIGYARVSTGDQHPEAQADRLRAAGCEQVFSDKGVSGTMARRPEWDKLLEQLQPGDALVCTKLDRIGRSVANLVEVTTLLQARDADLIVLDQAIDTTTPGGRLVFHILAAIAEFERELIVDRTRDGQLHVRRAGNLRRSLGGKPVLGFREDPEGDDWQLDPIAAGWLAEAAERVLGGEPVEAVHAALPAIRDAAGRPVTAKMLRAALQRPASAGLIADDGGYLPAAIGGPLDEPTFNRLAVLFGARKTGRPVDAGRYWAGPVLRCGKCGNQLTGEVVNYRGDRRPYYRCANPHKGLGVARPCRGCSVLAEDVHELIAIFIEAWVATPGVQQALAKAAGASAEVAARRGELAARIAELQDQVAGLETKRMRQHISPARYAELAAEAEVMIDQAAAELAELDRIAAEPGVPLLFEWEELTPAEKLRSLELAVVTPIVVQPGNGGGAARSVVDRIDLIPLGG